MKNRYLLLCSCATALIATQERHLVDRQTYNLRRSAVLAEWQSLAN